MEWLLTHLNSQILRSNIDSTFENVTFVLMEKCASRNGVILVWAAQSVNDTSLLSPVHFM